MLDSIRHQAGKFVSPRLRGRLIAWEEDLAHRLGKVGLVKYFEPFLMKSYLARPQEIDIEVTSSCDADCIMCPRKAMSRNVGPMNLALFKKIVDEAVSLGVRELQLNGYGEISVLRNYRDYLSYIREKSRSIRININTNAMRMNEDMARFYVESEVSSINVAIDGATAETYAGIRRNLELDVVEKNARRLIQIRNEMGKKYPLVRISMIAMPQNVHEVDLFLEKWSGVADRVGISGLVSRVGSVSFAQVESRSWERTPCFLLWQQMPVLSDGTVAMCCDDWDGRASQGNLNQNTIKEIWTSRKRQSIRSVHLDGKASMIPLCKSCKQPRQGPIWFSSKHAVRAGS